MTAASPQLTPEPVRAKPSRPPARLSATGLRSMLDSGMRVGEIADVTGYARSTITRHLNAHGIDPKSQPGPRSKLPAVDEIIARIEAGERPSEIARSAGATPAAVSHALYRAGLRLDRGRILPKES